MSYMVDQDRQGDWRRGVPGLRMRSLPTEVGLPCPEEREENKNGWDPAEKLK